MRSATWARVGILSLLGLLVTATSAMAQDRPRPVLSPEVHPNHEVTFRLRAPEAETVVLTGEFMPGPLPMAKGDDGVWSVTYGPIEPEDYEYEFTIDGMTFLDPRNPTVKTNQGPSGISSVLTVRGRRTARFFDVRPGPARHGGGSELRFRALPYG